MTSDADAAPFLLVDTDEMRSAGNATLADSDLVETASKHILMPSSSDYGAGDVKAAARRFSDRFSYALQQLSAEVEEAGRTLRGTAEAYEYMDTSAADTLDQIGRAW